MNRISVIYADVFFINNFFVDYVLLCAVARLLGRRPLKKRVCAAALLGAALSCLWLLLFTGSAPAWGIGIPCALLMQCLVLGDRGKRLLAETTALCLQVPLLAGLWQMLIQPGLERLCFQALRRFLPVLIALLLLLAVSFVRREGARSMYVEAELIAGDRRLRARGLIDSGNRLREPTSQRPVHVISQKSLVGWESMPLQGVLWIPYRSVGAQGRLLPAITIDRMIINKEIIIRAPIIAISAVPVSSDDAYQLLIHPGEVVA